MLACNLLYRTEKQPCMSGKETETSELLEKIDKLEEENRLLKERLQEAGISYQDIID